MNVAAKGQVTFDSERCKACGLCVAFCPNEVLKLNEKQINGQGYTPAYAANMEKCTGCGICAMMCPDVAITVERA